MMEPLNGILHFHGVSSFYKLILFAKIRRMGYQVHLCIIYFKKIKKTICICIYYL